MYFISTGYVEVFLRTTKLKKAKTLNPDVTPIDESLNESQFVSKEERIARLKDGLYFGEIALITNLKRTTTVKACDFLTLAFIE